MNRFLMLGATALITVCLGCQREPTAGDKIRDVGDAVGDAVDDVADDVHDVRKNHD